MANRVINLKLEKPSLKDNRADGDRLIAGIRKKLGTSQNIHIDFDLLKQLPYLLRKWDYRLKCVLFKDRDRYEVAGILPPDENKMALGLAVDLGTTRVVLRLINLENGKALGESGFDNPQIEIAPDILDRIHYTDTEGGLEKLRDMIITGLNDAIKELCKKHGASSKNVYIITIAGNTAMTHLLLGITPHWVIREPYIPAVNDPGILKASYMGIEAAKFARVLVFPNVGSYFGGDLIAGVLFSGMNKTEDVAILVDVGTNAEVILGNKDWLIACAGAAGPALESGVSKMGMMAGPGVIETVTIDPGTREILYETIANEPPRGMCGSGIIDLAAHLFLSGMIDIRGKFVPEKCGHRLKTQDDILYIVVVPKEKSATGHDLTISQIDLDSLIRSKAAMYTILETITASVGMTPRDLETFYVAGTFGSFIKPKSAITIGMIPDLPIKCYKALGNSSLEGAAMALMTDECLEEIDKIRNRITYIELNVNQELMNRFSAAKFLPHTDPFLFPSVKVWG